MDKEYANKEPDIDTRREQLKQILVDYKKSVAEDGLDKIKVPKLRLDIFLFSIANLTASILGITKKGNLAVNDQTASMARSMDQKGQWVAVNPTEITKYR